MKKIQLFYIAFILLLFGGCTDEVSGVLDDLPVNRDGSIAFGMDSIITKGTPRDDVAAYKAVHLLAYSHTGTYANGKSLYRETVLEKISGSTPPKWDYSPHMFWPEGRGLSFLAYASDTAFATIKGNDGVRIIDNGLASAPTIEYIIPTNVTQQPDLLVTALLNHKEVNSVILPMQHALACVSFCATGPADTKVKSITLNNVYRKATLKLDSIPIGWVLDPNDKKTIIFAPGINPDKLLEDNPTDGNYLMTANGYLMMIPQKLTDATIDVVYWKETAGTENKITYNLPTEIEWLPGKKYIYKFGESAEEIVVYYEKYADESYGVHTHVINTNIPNSLDDTKTIIEAGYGVLTKSKTVTNTPTIRLGTGSTAIPATKVARVVTGYDLYKVNQTGTPGISTFVLPARTDIVAVYFDKNGVSCGNVTPHFAKGVHNIYNLKEYAIRTPQQMKNISALTTDSDDTTGDVNNPTVWRNFRQEKDLDFSSANSTIGGGPLTGAVVDHVFSGTYTSDSTKSIININIDAKGDYIGLFAKLHGSTANITLKSSSIKGANYVGGIAGYCNFDGSLTNPRIIGTNSTIGSIKIDGTSKVGGLVGELRGVLAGNGEVDPATGVPYATVSGWVNIVGTGNEVGGIVGVNNNYTISKTLVYGVYVSGPSTSDVTPSSIKIEGNQYVGGIAGVNFTTITGNAILQHTDSQKFPDVAGIVDISGTDWVGGITGSNAGTLNTVNVRLGRSQGILKITGTGSNVGGIAGTNGGTLGGTFTSVRGNVAISGLQHVGGIVGQNTAGTLTNCFVHDYYTRTGTLEYFSPTITASFTNAGGIAGSNNASITNCSVFSSTRSKAPLKITAQNNAGGITGVNQPKTNASNSKCSFVGNVVTEATNQNSGGIAGASGENATIYNCWIGNTDGFGIIENARTNLKLDITTPFLFGKPLVTGKYYIGGIVGFNDLGVIRNITISDDLTIGRVNPDMLSGSENVGGIAGGNAISTDELKKQIFKCYVQNSKTIQGHVSVGGIVGLNNGVVDDCHVSGTSTSKPNITGTGTTGGIIGQNGSHAVEKSTGNKYTSVRNCTVTGYAAITGHEVGYDTAIEVGGIIGLNGATEDLINNVFNCKVNGSAAGSITISVAGTTGGIAGKNSGNISQCDVLNADVYSVSGYAGGIAGLTISSANSTPTPPADGSATTNKLYRSDLKDCRIYNGVTIRGGSSYLPGALVGYINSIVTYILGSTNINSVNSTGVSVNGVQPTLNNLIWGHNTGDGGLGKATINHDVQPIPPR